MGGNPTEMVQHISTLLGGTSQQFGAKALQNPNIGLTGIDPKFIQDPRFDYQTILKPSGIVLMGNAKRDDYDSAPIGEKSTLAVDKPWQSIAADMEGRSEGPSPWFTQNAREIMGKSKTATKEMAEKMRQRMLSTRDRIEDRY